MKRLRMESTPSNGKTVQEWKVIRLSGNILPFSIRSSVLTAEHVCNPCSIWQRTQGNVSSLQITTEISNGYTSIHPKFNKPITSLSTAVENGEEVLDNEATSHNDVFDSFRLSLM